MSDQCSLEQGNKRVGSRIERSRWASVISVRTADTATPCTQDGGRNAFRLTDPRIRRMIWNSTIERRHLVLAAEEKCGPRVEKAQAELCAEHGDRALASGPLRRLDERREHANEVANSPFADGTVAASLAPCPVGSRIKSI